MDWATLLREEEKLRRKQRKAIGERSGLTDRKRRADPIRFSKVPDIPVVAGELRETPRWTESIGDTSLPATPPSVDKAAQTQHTFTSPRPATPANAQKQLDDLRQQLRKAYGLTDGDAQ